MTPIKRDEYGRAICTPERPWTQADGTPAAHTNIREVGEQEPGYPGGDIVTYKCSDCGVTWRAELPQ